MTNRANIISAICTPLDVDDRLSLDGLSAHIDDHASGGLSCLLIAGTMGLMPLLTDRTYLQLVEQAVRIGAERFELLIGVGDTSYARTRERIKAVDHLGIDGVVVLSPYFIRYRPEELVDYYKSLADVSHRPIFLYTNPIITGVELEIETVVEVSRHPNVRGIKCACEYDWTQRLSSAIDDADFRIIVARPYSVDTLIRSGIREHLDGIFSLAPHWATALIDAAQEENWEEAARYQARLSNLLLLVTEKYPTYASFTSILNARGIPGKIGPAPMRRLTTEEQHRLLNEPIVRELLTLQKIPSPKLRSTAPKAGLWRDKVN